jgi:adenine-specific DNA-methyltransferase
MPFAITRTELVWPGKYDDDGRRREVERISLPFQVIERVNESRASREAEKTRNPTLFDVWEGDTGDTFEDGWRNKLIWGDNKLVMSSLLDQFAGKIDLIYIDPPFAVGADFAVSVAVGDSGEELLKEQSAIEEKAYRDTWGGGMASYLSMMADRIALAHQLLSDKGTFYLHCDGRVYGYLRMLTDEIFGSTSWRNDIVWRYRRMPAPTPNFQKMHDVIIRYSRGDSWIYNQLYEPNAPSTQKAFGTKKLVTTFKETGEKVVRATEEESLGTRMSDVWEISYIQGSASQERSDGGYYPTQKPEELLARIVDSSTDTGSLVADFFGGSGTTAAVAEKLGRRWLSCDLGRYAVHTTRKRLLGIDGCKPFEVLNLGKYERKYWAVSTFGEDLDDDGLISLYEYVAFVLKLYGASPAAGMQHLHGKFGTAFVHVGAVDSPVTIDEIVACVDEAVALRAKELHILGWEWEMGLHDPISDEARRRGVNLVLRQIPREIMEQQAVAKGDIEFFELAYLDVEIAPTRKRHEVVAKLKNFVIPNPELVPDDVRSKITKWSDYVDYWAVDWDFADDTFMQGWVTYRTRKNRALDLGSDPHSYDGPGTYSVMVKVIDIFGNDTSKIISLTVE